MKRSQRRAHGRIWLVLGPALIAAVLWSLGSSARAPSSAQVEWVE